jgi:hypothetical protein
MQYVMKNQIHRFTLFGLILFIVINNFIFFPSNILSWDVFGYYLYLPLKFINNDLSITDISHINLIISKYHNTSNFYQGMVLPDGTYVMKYSMGMSFFYAPFFFIAHLFSKISSYPSDGYSMPYQFSIFIGSIIYSILGLWFLSKVLLKFFNNTITSMTLIVIVLSTNYIVHVTMYGQNAMSHSYLFMTYALILWLTILWHESFKLKYLVYLACVCGITILSRPSEIVCLIIPAFWGIYNIKTLKEKMSLLLIHKKQFFVFLSILFIIGFAQLAYWKIHTGKFLFYSYGANPGEGFEFFKPYIKEVLFSFRKGWLIYTPIMAFALLGLLVIYKKNKALFFALFIYTLVNLYIVSSWSCWWYAQTFRQRALIPSYPIMAIGFGFFLLWMQSQTKFFKMGLSVLIICLSILNIFQTIQFHKGVIDADRMTKDYYFKVFGKLSVNENDKKLLLVNRTFSDAEMMDSEIDYTSKLLQKIDFENSSVKDSFQGYNSKYSFLLNNSTKMSPTISATYSEITHKDHAWVKVTAYVYPTKDVMKYPFNLIVCFNHNEYPYKYMRYESSKMNITLNKWNKIEFSYLTPEVRNEKDYLKVYFEDTKESHVYIDDLEVNVYERK